MPKGKERHAYSGPPLQRSAANTVPERMVGAVIGYAHDLRVVQLSDENVSIPPLFYTALVHIFSLTGGVG
jgi:hypothetical protein